MPHTLIGQLSALACLGISGLALWRGHWPERVVALGLLGNLLAVVLFQDRVLWTDPDHQMLAADAALGGVLLCVALFTRRAWAVGAAAAQLLSVFTHLKFGLRPDPFVHPRAYLSVLIILNFVVLACVLWGALRARHR